MACRAPSAICYKFAWCPRCRLKHGLWAGHTCNQAWLLFFHQGAFPMNWDLWIFCNIIVRFTCFGLLFKLIFHCENLWSIWNQLSLWADQRSVGAFTLLTTIVIRVTFLSLIDLPDCTFSQLILYWTCHTYIIWISMTFIWLTSFSIDTCFIYH